MSNSNVRRKSDITEKSGKMVFVEKVEKKVQVGKHSIFALKKCSLSLEAGDTLAILGSSGTGKSTLIHLIAGLERPSSGEIRVKKSLVSEMSDGDRAKFRKENVGVIYQFHHLLPEFNVLENVMKMENSLLFIFGKIWPKTMYYSTGTLTQFWSNFKNSLKI